MTRSWTVEKHVDGIAKKTKRATDPSIKGLTSMNPKLRQVEVVLNAARVSFAKDAVEERARSAAGEEERGE